MLAACGGGSSGARATPPTKGSVLATAILSGEGSSAGIRLQLAGPTTVAAVTDAAGQYLFDSLPQGDYTLVATASSTAEGSLTAPAHVTAGVRTTPAALLFTPLHSVAAPVVAFGACTPAVATDGTAVAITFSADAAVEFCAASVGGLPATCAAPSGALCGCTFTVTPASSEGALAVVVSATRGGGVGYAQGALTVHRTPPAVDTSLMAIQRRPAGQDDAVTGAAGALPGASDPDPNNRPVRARFYDAAGQPRATAIPRADGSFDVVPLPGTGGATPDTLSPGRLFASAVDAAGNESARMEIAAGRSVTAPRGDGNRIAFARRAVGVPDGLAAAAAFADPDLSAAGAAAIVALRLWTQDGTLYDQVPADGGGGFAEVTLQSPWQPALDGFSPARLWVSAVDKFGAEGPRVEALVGGASSGPAGDGSRMTVVRRPLGANDAVEGSSGAFAAACAVATVTAYDGQGNPLATGPAGTGGSFLEIPVGTFTESYPTLLAGAVDKCGLVGPAVEVLNGADRTAPTLDPTRLAFHARPVGTADGLSGDAGAALDNIPGYVRELRAYDLGGAALASGVAPAADGSFPEQPLGDLSGDQVQVGATDKAGNLSSRVLSRKVVADLGLAGRTRQAPLQPLQGALFAYRAPFHPRLASPADAFLLGAEVGAADALAAATPNDGAFAHTAAAPFAGGGAGWSLASGGPRAFSAAALDVTRGRLVVFGGDDWSQILSETLEWDGSAWSRPAPGSSPRPRTQAAMAFAGAGQVLLFGGLAADGTLLDDTWTWNGTAWTQLFPLASPLPRTGAAVAWDSARQRVVLFGGCGAAAPCELHDTWEWNGVGWSNLTPAAPADSPPDRFGGALAYDSTRRRTVLFGGDATAPMPPRGDTWEWDGATSTWTQDLPAQGPSARGNSGLAYDPTRGLMVLAGGDVAPHGDETWTFDGITWTLASAKLPTPRSFHALAYEPTSARTWLVGDMGYDTLAVLTWDGVAWSAKPMAVPPARSRPPAAFDPERGQLLVHGEGTDLSPATTDTFFWDGARWTAAASGGDTPLAQAALAWDPLRGKGVLFGCPPAAAALPCGTWEWDGATFAPVSTPHLPPARTGHALAFDGLRGAAVLFGGRAYSDGSLLSDTWVYDGADWTLLSVGAAPPPREAAGLAYDARRGVVVLFGGNGADRPLGDLWEFSAAGWASVAAAGPAASAAPSLAFDPWRGMTVLHDDTGSTWEWNGVAWSGPVSDGAGPGARSGAALVYDPALGSLALYGGTMTGAPTGDLWLLDRRVPAPTLAAQVAVFTLDPGATLTAAHVDYLGAGRGDAAGAPSYGVEVLAWDGIAASWVSLGTSSAPETAMTAIPADLLGPLPRFGANGRVALLFAPSAGSSLPTGAGIPSEIWTDSAQLHVEYLLP